MKTPQPDKIGNHQFLNLCDSEQITYDGTAIASHWALDRFDILGNSMISFRGPLKVPQSEMVDLLDIKEEGDLGTYLITGKEAVQWIIEDFSPHPPNLELEYSRLRILVLVILEVLRKNIPDRDFRRSHTDIYVGNQKLSVGIATISKVSAKMHYALNLSSEEIPTHVKAIGLYDMGLKSLDVHSFSEEVGEAYLEEISRIERDCMKTRSV
ncbi:MAG: DUF366 family protein [Candidatus Kariarchaeaceae archaeon]